MEITTLIPAYRADFLGDAFRGLAEQTYKNFNVIISDDSPGQKISEMIRGGAYSEYTKSLHITLLNGPKDEVKNHNNLIKYWAGSSHLAHVHHDDDYIFPNFYEKHVEAHRHHDVLLSVSGRWFAKADGIPCQSPATPSFLANAKPQFQKLNQCIFYLNYPSNKYARPSQFLMPKGHWRLEPCVSERVVGESIP